MKVPIYFKEPLENAFGTIVGWRSVDAAGNPITTAPKPAAARVQQQPKETSPSAWDSVVALSLQILRERSANAIKVADEKGFPSFDEVRTSRAPNARDARAVARRGGAPLERYASEWITAVPTLKDEFGDVATLAAALQAVAFSARWRRE